MLSTGDSIVIRIRHKGDIPRSARRILSGARSVRIGAAGFVAGCIMLGVASCDLRTVSSSLENLDESAYRVVSSGSSGTLYLRIPWPGVESEESFPTGIISETPPGQIGGVWREQVSVIGSPLWREPQEYWYSWFLLHLLAIDRERMPDPRTMRSQGVESLFVAATRDPATGAYDRFTRYYPPEDAGRVGAALTGATTYMRFGYFLRALPNDTVVVGSVVAGGPADRAGLKRDDRVLDIDGSPVDTVLKHLDNTKSTMHAFRVFRPSAKTTISIQIATGEVSYPTVWADTLPGGIGYISITQFVSDEGATTDDLFRAAISEMNGLRRNRTAWILDLRDNGGGTIISAQGVAGALLGPRQPLVRVREREVDDGFLQGYTRDTVLYSPSDNPQILPEGKIMFLQDGWTASASEILLSSLRETIPTQIVSYGELSYGKGIGQLYMDTPLGAFAAVTCMHIDPMKAPRYHHVGISPDIETTSDQALVRALADIASIKDAGARRISSIPTAGILRADRWNRFEARPSTAPPPLKPSSIPGARGIW